MVGSWYTDSSKNVLPKHALSMVCLSKKPYAENKLCRGFVRCEPPQSMNKHNRLAHGPEKMLRCIVFYLGVDRDI